MIKSIRRLTKRLFVSKKVFYEVKQQNINKPKKVFVLYTVKDGIVGEYNVEAKRWDSRIFELTSSILVFFVFFFGFIGLVFCIIAVFEIFELIDHAYKIYKLNKSF